MDIINNNAFSLWLQQSTEKKNVNSYTFSQCSTRIYIFSLCDQIGPDKGPKLLNQGPWFSQLWNKVYMNSVYSPAVNWGKIQHIFTIWQYLSIPPRGPHPWPRGHLLDITILVEALMDIITMHYIGKSTEDFFFNLTQFCLFDSSHEALGMV